MVSSAIALVHHVGGPRVNQLLLLRELVAEGQENSLEALYSTVLL